MLSALIVSYNFPPVGGAGVQRVLKLVKYLPAHGVTPRVLTVANPSVPVLDATLERDFPPGLEVLRARTFEPGYGAKRAAWQAKGDAPRAEGGSATRLAALRRGVTQAATRAAKELLFPDPQLLWQPAAQLALLRAMRPRPDVVFISGPPFSQFLLAPAARLWARGTALVLDYRDEWSTYRESYEMMGSRIARTFGDPLERSLLRMAHAVTLATPEFRDALLSRYPFVDAARVVAIPNGFDPADVPNEAPPLASDRVVVSYAGTVFKLTSVRGFLAGLRLFHERAPAQAKKLSVRFMGRIVETESDAFEGTEALGVARLGYLPHDEVLRALAGSHLNLCVLDDVPGVDRIYPAKIFELLALGRPVLTLAPEGALTRLVREARLGPVIAPRDEAAIATALDTLVTAVTTGAPSTFTAAPPPAVADRYSRVALAGDFATVFRDAVARAKR